MSKLTIHYKDVDLVDIASEQPNAVIAYNCPYIYLAHPTDPPSNERRYFYPKLLIPTQEMEPVETEHLLITAGRMGICENVVVIKADGGVTAKVYAPERINNSKFSDIGVIEGGFIAITLFGKSVTEFNEMSFEEKNDLFYDIEKQVSSGNDPAPFNKKEIKIRPKSADTTPNHVFLNIVNSNTEKHHSSSKYPDKKAIQS